jgi:hypothetical protein
MDKICSRVLFNWRLTLSLLTWRICRVLNNVSKWQMGFNLEFKGLIASGFSHVMGGEKGRTMYMKLNGHSDVLFFIGTFCFVPMHRGLKTYKERGDITL